MDRIDRPYRPRLVSIALILYTFAIFYVTWMPFDFNWDALNWERFERHSERTLFVMLDGEPASVRDIVSNLLLFFPLGILAAYVLAGRRKDPPSRVYNLLAIMSLSGVMSLLIETVQLGITHRVMSITDLVLDIGGATIGGVLACEFKIRYHQRAREALKTLTLVSANFPLFILFAIAFIIKASSPFDITRDLYEVWTKTAADNFQVVLFSARFLSLADNFFLFTILSFLSYDVLGATYHPREQQPFVLTSLGLSAAAFLGEVVKCFIVSRMPSLIVFGAGLVGILYGIAFHRFLFGDTAVRPVRAPLDRWRMPGEYAFVLPHYFAILLLSVLYPYNFTVTDILARINDPQVYVPFYGYFFKWDIFSLSDFLLSLAVFLPFGYILCILFQGPAESRARAYTISVLVGGAIALLTETFQIFLPGRYVDLSDVASAMIGVLTGCLAWSWHRNYLRLWSRE